MNAKTEKDIVLYYLNNLIKRSVSGDIETRICDWFEENSRELIGREIADRWENRRFGWRQKAESEPQPLPRNVRSIRQFLGGKTGRFVISSDVKAVIDAFHLAPESHDILAIRVYAAKIPILSSLVDHHNTNQVMQMLASMMDISIRRHEKFYSPSSELRTKGLFGNDARHHDGSHEMTAMLNDIIVSHSKTPNMVKRVVLGNPLTGALKPVHFEHLREEYDWLRNLMSNTLAKKKRNRSRIFCNFL